MNTFSITDTGRVRTNNQDSVFCEENAVGSFPNLFLVADGMGGHKAGDMASKMCVEQVVRSIQTTDKKTPVGVFEGAVEMANRAIYEQASSNSELAGMGTTLVAVTIEDETAYIVNVGDSRLYLLRDTLQMRTHPNKNIITRALGTDLEVQPDCFEIEVRQGDVLLLCSDGLSNMLEDEKMEQIVKSHIENMEQAGKCLVEQANEAGGKDNITVVLIGI